MLIMMGGCFYHSHDESHQDHLLSVEAAISAVFQPVMDDALYKGSYCY